MNKAIGLCALLASLTGYSKTYQVSGQASFNAQGNPGFVHITGDGAHVKGSAEEGADGKVSGTFVVQLKDLTTGMSLRDEHMHTKYLQDSKWPEARLTLTPWPRSASASPFSGQLSLHGQTHSVVGVASVSADGKLHANFTATLSDYGIDVPSWAGVTVAKDVTVDVDAEVQ